MFVCSISSCQFLEDLSAEMLRPVHWQIVTDVSEVTLSITALHLRRREFSTLYLTENVRHRFQLFVD